MRNSNPRGSEWLRWDLHIHSDASDGHGTPEQIIEEAKKKKLDVIALTDHHTAKNIDRIKEIGRDNGVTVISGIEFKSDSGSKSVHLIGLFPDNFKNHELNAKGLHDLILAPLGFSETAIINRGKELDNSLDDKKAFKNGMLNVFAAFKAIADKIHEYGGIVVAHAGNKANSVEEMKHKGSASRNVKTLYECLGPVKEELFKKGFIDICEIGSDQKDSEFYYREFNKPSIQASDAHKIDEIGRRFTWIKANPSFEGLKQILFEPEMRVSLNDEKPDAKPDYQVISSLKIDHEDFGTQQIMFNQNLNTIIGGRSSGKSILLGVIAKKIGSTLEVKKDLDYQKYIQAITDKSTLSWRDEERASGRDIEYFPQSYINNLAAGEEETRSLIERTIKSDDSKRALIETYSSFCINNKGKLIKEITNYFVLRDRIKEKEEEIKSKGNKRGIEKEIEKIEAALQNVKNSTKFTATEAQMDLFEENLDRLKVNFDHIKELENHNLDLNRLKGIDLFIDLVEFPIPEKFIEDLNKLFKKIQEGATKEWERGINDLIVRNETKIGNLKSSIEEIEADRFFVECKKHFSSNDSFKSLEKTLFQEREKLNEINLVEKDLDLLQDRLVEVRDNILHLHFKYYDEADSIIAKLQYIKDEVVIKPFVRFRNEEFRTTLGERFNQRSHYIQSLVQYEYTDDLQYRQFVETDIFDSLINETISLKGSANIQQTVSDIFSRSYYEIAYDVTYQNDRLSTMSEGKKAFIILRLLLDFTSKQCPILIDQPEDDLDNRAVFKELVSYLRIKKQERQIILVTHNPNIVVGADAEEIIVANQHGKGNPNVDETKFQYITGALEDTYVNSDSSLTLEAKGIREHVCEILEGGDLAFKKREQKYGFKD